MAAPAPDRPAELACMESSRASEAGDARLAAFSVARAPLRRALARVAARFVATRGWERLGFARIADYARERLGLSASELHDLARVDAALARLPQTEAAFLAGRITWSKGRLLGRAATPEDEARWLEVAEGMSCAHLEREVRQVDLARLFRATLASVQRTLERTSGRASSPAAALEAMIDHAEAVWWVEAGRDPYDRRILARDGWRCAMPGCGSYGGLHVHHVIYRSHGGPEVPHNEITLCVWHHQRGQHGGLLRVTGCAPDRLRFEMPLETFRSGDLRVSPQP